MNLPCRKRLVKKGASGPGSGGGVDPTPIIDLVIEKSDPRPFTEIYMQVRPHVVCCGWAWAGVVGAGVEGAMGRLYPQGPRGD